jgi:lysyl-tRNA synthetase class II
MDDTNSLIEQRKAKLAALRAKGIDPFKNKFTPTESCEQARDNYAEGREVAVAGRITAHREMGKSQFIDVRDQSGRLQIYAQKNHLEETAPGSWDIFTHLDLGDFIGARGKLFTTKTGEISIKLDSFVILAKALRPPPEKWHGLADTEIRYRQRYLDLMANPDVKDVMLKRSEIIREIRNFLHARGYVEVETPMMQAIPGGAAAQPFKTHHNALNCDFYLRIALELHLKRLLVGGVDKVFEIGRNFRNEGLSRKHNPEFTMLEAYQAFGDYESMMELVESMVRHVAQKVLGTLKIEHSQGDAVAVAIELAQGKLDSIIGNTFMEFHNNNFIKISQKFGETVGGLRSELISIANQVGKLPAHEVARNALNCLNQVMGTLSAYKASVTGVMPTNRELEATVDKLIDEFRNSWSILSVSKNPKVIDLASPWRRVKYNDLVTEQIHPDWFKISHSERLAYAEQVLGVEVAGKPKRKLQEIDRKYLTLLTRVRSYYFRGNMRYPELPQSDKEEIDRYIEEVSRHADYAKKGIADFEITQAVFEKLIEPMLIQPTFVTHLPKELVPLAKLSPDDPTTVEVFECCINGQEISPGYTEQNDPIEQRERLEHQAGGEQQKLDEDFLVALEHGMPPAGGIGIGIDRLCMMLLGQESIRDVILFPQLKPK